jgi:hypothetical protein
MLGRTAEIVLPSISTSAFSKSPIVRSSVSTQPPLMSRTTEREDGLSGARGAGESRDGARR